MTSQTGIIEDFYVGEKLGPYAGEIATVTAVSDDSITVLIAGREITTLFPTVPVEPAPVQRSFRQRVAGFFA